jgi:hypothetical protein
LFLTEFLGFRCSADRCGEVAVLTEALHQNSSQGGVRLHDENA